MMRMTTELDKLKTDPQPHQFRNGPEQQRTCQLRIPAPQNDYRDFISSPSCRYSKMTEHEFADCTKQAWVEQQPWFTDRMHARDENGRIINNEHTHSKNQENWMLRLSGRDAQLKFRPLLSITCVIRSSVKSRIQILPPNPKLIFALILFHLLLHQSIQRTIH